MARLPVILSEAKDLSFCRITETWGVCMATGRLSLFNADWKRNVQILRSAQDDNEAKRVILSEAKDLSFCHVTETCGFCMETGRLSLFDADWKRNVQILRSAQDDNEAKRVILSGVKDLSFCRITETCGFCMAKDGFPFSMLIGNGMYGSFASLRMTTKRNVSS